jgi:hypothetical protein
MSHRYVLFRFSRYSSCHQQRPPSLGALWLHGRPDRPSPVIFPPNGMPQRLLVCVGNCIDLRLKYAPDAVVEWIKVLQILRPNRLGPLRNNVILKESLCRIGSVRRRAFRLEHEVPIRIHGSGPGHHVLAKQRNCWW